MPSIGSNELVAWLTAQGLALLVLAIVAFVAFQAARPLVRRLLVRVLAREQAAAAGADDELAAEEVRKRVATIEELLSTLLRAGVVIVAVLAILTVFDLLPVIAGLGVVVAAITLAGQSIVLDYLMGILIVVEGPFSKGDWIQVGRVEGEVEEIGLRRTILRDGSGTVHSVSNGEVRIASNLTRVYARMQVDVTVGFATDLDRVTEIANDVGREMAADPDWSERLLEIPQLVRVTGLGELGATLRIGGKVRATDRWAAPGELRRRLLVAFQANGIQIPAASRVVGAAGPPGPTAGSPAAGPEAPDGSADGGI